MQQSKTSVYIDKQFKKTQNARMCFMCTAPQRLACFYMFSIYSNGNQLKSSNQHET